MLRKCWNWEIRNSGPIFRRRFFSVFREINFNLFFLFLISFLKEKIIIIIIILWHNNFIDPVFLEFNSWKSCVFCTFYLFQIYNTCSFGFYIFNGKEKQVHVQTTFQFMLHFDHFSCLNNDVATRNFQFVPHFSNIRLNKTPHATAAYSWIN